MITKSFRNQRLMVFQTGHINIIVRNRLRSICLTEWGGQPHRNPQMAPWISVFPIGGKAKCIGLSWNDNKRSDKFISTRCRLGGWWRGCFLRIHFHGSCCDLSQNCVYGSIGVTGNTFSILLVRKLTQRIYNRAIISRQLILLVHNLFSYITAKSVL